MEKRLENRFVCADLVRVHWRSGHDAHTTEAVLEDIARLGACVQVEEEIPLGANVSITLGESQFAGEVCYCVYRDYGYFVGVRFDDETTWSSLAVQPAHLTNLQAIAINAMDE